MLVVGRQTSLYPLSLLPAQYITLKAPAKKSSKCNKVASYFCCCCRCFGRSGKKKRRQDINEELQHFSTCNSNDAASQRTGNNYSWQRQRLGEELRVASVDSTPQTDGNENTVLQRHVPVLYSTNRGLYLRVAKPNGGTSFCSNLQIANTSEHREVCDDMTGSNYDINFCDLERWSTNRANAIGLDDTFTVRKHMPLEVSSNNNGSYSLASFKCKFTYFDN